jgi:CHAD domain-containing protein
MDVAVEVLTRPAGYGARLLALSFLDEAQRARKRMGDPHDEMALHDFRVALRRLRSCLRAYRPQLDGCVQKKQRRRLRRLVKATGTRRDLQVQVTWLEEQRPTLDDRERAGLDWLIERLKLDEQQVDVRLEHTLREQWPKLRRRMERDLPHYSVEVRRGRAPVEEEGAALLARLVRGLWVDLRGHLGRVSSVTDVDEAHSARIAAKRLRYLLLPIKPQLGDAEVILDRLEALQDVLGEIHDAHVLESDLHDAITASPRQLDRPATLDDSPLAPDVAQPSPTLAYDVRLGLLALARRAQDRREAAYARYHEGWSSLSTAVFFRQLDQLADRLSRHTPELPPED